MQQPGGQGTFLALNRTTDGTARKASAPTISTVAPSSQALKVSGSTNAEMPRLTGIETWASHQSMGRPVAACGRKQAQGRQPGQQPQAGRPGGGAARR